MMIRLKQAGTILSPNDFENLRDKIQGYQSTLCVLPLRENLSGLAPKTVTEQEHYVQFLSKEKQYLARCILLNIVLKTADIRHLMLLNIIDDPAKKLRLSIENRTGNYIDEVQKI
ncbi:19842_t:CDS:2 [Dentiscutata erythropus]|uniref:19842_t:CDS:1 n=1 Tax=Dentiscutata erythropus TaxID=1348616 RepID=A0A9N9E8K6_9GLOM|nr:19842_t:CDS:2 [Dentiscutata erythropus]